MSAQRLRIAYVVGYFGRRFGGAEAYGVDLMQQLSQHHDITVVARHYDEPGVQLTYQPVQVSTRWPSWLQVALFARRARRLTSGRFDIVHSHVNGQCGDVEVIHVTPVRYNWRVRPLPWLKRALSYTSLRVQTYLHLEARRVAPRPAHRVVAVSDLTREQLRLAYGTTRDYPVIPPGVHLPAPITADVRHSLRAAQGYQADDHVLLMVARDPWRKGLPTALQALAKLPAHFKLLVVGADADCATHLRTDPHYRDDLAARIQLIPPSPDIARYYQLADICIHPTRNDSFGMAPLEALAHGLPLIVSPAPYCGFAHYLQHQHDALLLSAPDNADQLAQFALQLAHTPALAQQLPQHAQALVARHDWSALAQRYGTLYQAILDERQACATHPNRA